MVEHGRCFLVCTENMSRCKKHLSAFCYLHKIAPRFNHRLNIAIFYNLIAPVLKIETI